MIAFEPDCIFPIVLRDQPHLKGKAEKADMYKLQMACERLDQRTVTFYMEDVNGTTVAITVVVEDVRRIEVSE